MVLVLVLKSCKVVVAGDIRDIRTSTVFAARPLNALTSYYMVAESFLPLPLMALSQYLIKIHIIPSMLIFTGPFDNFSFVLQLFQQ